MFIIFLDNDRDAGDPPASEILHRGGLSWCGQRGMLLVCLIPSGNKYLFPEQAADLELKYVVLHGIIGVLVRLASPIPYCARKYRPPDVICTEGFLSFASK